MLRIRVAIACVLMVRVLFPKRGANLRRREAIVTTGRSWRVLIVLVAALLFDLAPSYGEGSCPKFQVSGGEIEARIVKRSVGLGNRKFETALLKNQPTKENGDEPDLKGISIHSTAVPFVLRQGRDGCSKLRGHHDSHYQPNKRGVKLGGIAYHYYIDITGAVFEGRDLKYVGGTYTNYDPKGLITVVLEGAFSESTYGGIQYDANEPTVQQISTLKELLVWLSAKNGINPMSEQVGKGIHGHDEFPAIGSNALNKQKKVETSCPGRNLSRRMAELRQSTRDGLAR